jgi:energy-coupling factor transporter ATP-binding protein EcfA2
MIATYQPHPIARFCGNPLTEALTFIDDKTLLLKSVERQLEIINFWALAPIYQQAVLQDFARVHIPTPQFYSLYSKFMSLLLDTYSQAHPFSTASQKDKYHISSFINDKKASWVQNIEMAGRTTAPSILITGPTGVGKTTEVRFALGCIPQVIEHHNYNGRHYRQDQLVWISIDLPSTPSIKALALNFFLAVDEALGCTSYHDEWSKKANTSVDRHLNGMRQIAVIHELGLIHIDELQFMLKYAKSKDSPTLQMLEALFNKIGIPIILSCTTQGLTLFDMPSSPNGLMHDMTTTRRMLSDREFKFDIHKVTSPYFRSLYDAFFPNFLQFKDTVLDEAFFLKFHSLTCGLPAIMSRLAHLYHETHLQLRERGSRKIPTCIELLEHVYKHQFKLIDPALRQLRRNQISQYEAVITNDGKEKATFTDKESKVVKSQNKSVPLSVNKGGIFDEHAANITEINTGFTNGFV